MVSKAVKPSKRVRQKTATYETVDVGSGDVFTDLGFADAGERKLRVQLAMQLNRRRRWWRCSAFRSRTCRNSKTTSSRGFPRNG
jgi:hypothetical protein